MSSFAISSTSTRRSTITSRSRGGWRLGAAALVVGAPWSCDSATEPIDIAAEARFPLSGWLVTQDFGTWNPGWNGYHLAEDANAGGGDSVFAMADGVVRATLTGLQGYEALVLIEHRFEDGFVVSLYGHVSTRRGFRARTGERVTRGQLIALVGDDDEDGGDWRPHLHFGIRSGPYSEQGEICGQWLYVGYTRSCPDITNEEYRELWFDPTDFILEHGGQLPGLD
jgi:murein DD-endopeptidase MepM/ murein hydrolase activator NlpD